MHGTLTRMSLILVTNDDGIESPGLRSAAEAVLPLGEVVVVAPSSQQSSVGRSLQGNPNEAFKKVELKIGDTAMTGYHCECSPARVVLHAFDVLFHEKKPDLLVSGINYGENLGNNITISGTVGAALQAASHGVPGLAMSLQTGIADHRRHSDQEWDAARHFCHMFAALMLKAMMPADVDILNVNVPAAATIKTPWKVTRLSRRSYFVNHLANPTPASKLGDGQCHYGFEEASLEPDSDIRAIRSNWVSVTPITMDLTARVDLKSFLMGGGSESGS